MSITDWQEYEQRRETYERLAQAQACAEHAARKARRRARRREFLHWCNPLVHVAGHPGEPTP